MIDALLHLRRSVRDFRDQKIDNYVINNILEAGRLSPSGNNRQPWLFGAITDKEQIELIAEAAYQQKFIKSAPLVIVLCTDISDYEHDQSILKAQFPSMSDAIDQIDSPLLETIYSKEHQTKIPGSQMVLRALDEGIGACWVSYFNSEQLSKCLNLPTNYIATEIIVFGYPKESLKPRSKKEFENIRFYNKFKE